MNKGIRRGDDVRKDREGEIWGEICVNQGVKAGEMGEERRGRRRVGIMA